jgi:hypothetical protein
MHGVDDHAPQLRIPTLLQAGGQEQGSTAAVTGLQPQALPPPHQAPHQEAAGMDSHHHPTRPGLKAAVDHEQIAINDAIAAHGITTDPHEEGGQGRGDQLPVEIDASLDIVLGRTGKACGDGLSGQSAEMGLRFGPQGHRQPGRQTPEQQGSRGHGHRKGQGHTQRRDAASHPPISTSVLAAMAAVDGIQPGVCVPVC